MKFKILMVIKAIVCLCFGALILLVPDFVYGLFGKTLNDIGMVAARQYSASLLGVLLVTWLARNAEESIARRAIIAGLCIYDAIGFVVALIATLTGVFNPLGWAIVALYLFLAIGFGYFWVRPPKP